MDVWKKKQKKKRKKRERKKERTRERKKERKKEIVAKKKSCKNFGKKSGCLIFEHEIEAFRGVFFERKSWNKSPYLDSPLNSDCFDI